MIYLKTFDHYMSCKSQPFFLNALGFTMKKKLWVVRIDAYPFLFIYFSMYLRTKKKKKKNNAIDEKCNECRFFPH